MSPVPDFSELLPQWRAQSKAECEIADARLSEELKRLVMADPGGSGTAPSATLTRKLQALLVQQAGEALVPRCLGWLEERGVWKSPDLKKLAAADIMRALSVTSESVFHLPAARVAPAPFGWLVIVFLGAVAGGGLLHLAEWVFALPPDDTSRRAVVSAAIGAGVVAALTAKALERPEQRAAFDAAARARGFFSRYRAIKAALAQAGAGGSALLPLIVFYLLRPKPVPPSQEDRLSGLRTQFDQELARLSDQVLALCLTHPDCLPSGPDGERADAEREPLGVYEAVGALESSLLRAQADHEELPEAAQELLQRFRDEGFEWRQAPPDARFDGELEAAFRPYGLLEPGDPVATRKPALFRHGKLLIRGILSARK